MDTALSRSTDLGPLLSTHRARYSIIVARLAGGAALAGLAVLIVSRYAVIADSWLALIIGSVPSVLAVLPLLFSLILILSAVLHVGQVFSLHSGGIVYRRGLRRTAIRWEDIEQVYRRNLHGKKQPTLGIQALTSCVESFDVYIGGKRVSIDSSVSGFDQLWPVIEDQVTQRLLPKAIDAYHKGETLDFGRVQMSSLGVSACGGVPVPWSEVEFAAVDGSVQFEGKNRPVRLWIDTSVGKIANVLLLVRLVQTLALCPIEDRLKRWRYASLSVWS